MPRSVERWLETFMCKQYAEIFEVFGIKSLQSVCQLQVQQLQSMRIPPEHCELILQNVQILRQSMSGGLMQQQYGDEMGGYANSRLTPGGGPGGGAGQGAGYQARDSMGAMGMGGGGYGGHMSGNGDYGNQRPSAAAAMMSQQHQQQYSSQAMYHQQLRQQQQQQQQQYMGSSTPHHQYPGNPSPAHMGMTPPSQSHGAGYGDSDMSYGQKGSMSPGKAMYRQQQQQQPPYPGKVPGSAGPGQSSSMHQSHPHLRNPGQNPQDVANTILQMASSSYPPSHTVQVPLSKNRSAPYHIPPRSPQYGQDSQQMPMSSQGQFMYPNTSPHPSQQQQMPQHTRMSPASPGSGVMGMMPSPHSHHSGHSISSSSPCSLHSPGTRDIQSPVSDMATPIRRTPSNLMSSSQQMASPQRGQYCSPGSTPHHQRMVSPGPAGQQHHMGDPYSSLSQQQQQQQHQLQQQQQMYRESMSGYPCPTSHAHGQTMQQQQYPTGCSAQLSPGAQSSHSVSSGHSGNVPSPYNPGPKPAASYSPSPSQNQPYSKHQPPQPPPYSESPAQQSQDRSNTNQQTKNNGATNPLQSLQKLCMLPERQVVDPKSVVNDACAPSPQSNEFPKNLHMNADSQGSDFGVEGRTRESASSYTDCQSEDGRKDTTPSSGNISATTECSSEVLKTSNDIEGASSVDHASQELNSNKPAVNQSEQKLDHRQDTSNQSGATNTHEIDEVRCQPKKMMLLRATKEEFRDTSQALQMIQAEPQMKGNSEQTESQLKDGSEIISKKEENSVSDENDFNKVVGTNQNAEQTSQECTEQIEDDKIKAKTDENELSDFDDNISDIQEINTNPSVDQTPPEKETDVIEESPKENLDDVSLPEKLDQNNEENVSASVDKKSMDEAENASDIENKNSSGIEKELEGVKEKEEKPEQCNENSLDSIGAPVGGIQSSAVDFVTEIMDSDEESQLVVRKDTKSTYSKTDRIKDHPLRSRGLSTGSLSDGEESELEFEDHIGCDDIENDFSYSDEKEVVEIDENEDPEIMFEVNVQKPAITNVNGINRIDDKVVLTSPHWKKSRLNDLQEAGTDACSSPTRNIGRKVGARANHVNGINSVGDVVEIDCDDDIPSPSGAGVMAIDNGDCTMAVAGATRVNHRRRKTPIKFKDTSFFQGDFIFEEEENEDDETYVPKKKCAKKFNSTDMNHNMKRNELEKNKVISETKDNITQKDNVKDKKTKNNINAKSKHLMEESEINKPDSNSVEEKVNGDISEMSSELAVGHKKKSERGSSTERSKKPGKPTSKTGSSSDKVVNAVKSETSKRSVRSSHKHDSAGSDISVPAKTCDSVKPKKPGSKSRESPRSKGSAKSDAKNKVFNGSVKSESCDNDSDNRTSSGLLNGIRNTTDESSHVKLEENSKPCVDEAMSEEESVILVGDSEDSVDAVVAKSLLKKSSRQAKAIKRDNDSDGNDDRIINVKDDIKHEKADLAPERLVTKKKATRGPDLKKRKPRNLVASDEPKIRSAKKKNAAGRKLSKYDEDLDFDLGTDKKSLKSKLNRTQDLLSSQKKKEKKDKGVDFKGPVIRLEGAKENPEKCIVINDPLDHTDSKIKKAPTQTVTSIHISHMPADKSILVPHNDAEAGKVWTCALCGKHSSYKFLGDLFGPYTIENMAEDTPHFARHIDSKRRKSDGCQPSSSRSSLSSRKGTSAEKFREVWVHEACAVWSDGVFLINAKIYGLQEAVDIASQTPCSSCQEMGAMIGCLNKGCQQKYHTACAMEKECFLDEENFSLLCPKHKLRKLKMLEMAAGKPGTVT